MSKRKLSSFILCAMLLALCFPAEAQQAGKIFRIGYLSQRSGNETRDEAFRQGLRELGYVEGKNIIIELRGADGKLDRLPALASELVRLKVDIIVSTSGAVTSAAKQATSAIPIVMTNDADPVANRLVA